jgi:hypothetical protein
MGAVKIRRPPVVFLNVISERRLPLEAGTALTNFSCVFSKRIAQTRLPLAPFTGTFLPMAYAPFDLHQFGRGKSPRSPRQPESATALLIQKIKG